MALVGRMTGLFLALSLAAMCAVQVSDASPYFVRSHGCCNDCDGCDYGDCGCGGYGWGHGWGHGYGLGCGCGCGSPATAYRHLATSYLRRATDCTRRACDCCRMAYAHKRHCGTCGCVGGCRCKRDLGSGPLAVPEPSYHDDPLTFKDRAASHAASGLERAARAAAPDPVGYAARFV